MPTFEPWAWNYLHPTWPVYTPPPQPWLCPKCSRVYGPTATECKPCNDALTRGSPSTEERGEP